MYICNMKKIIGIYKITSPSGRIYIGESIDCYRRWNREYLTLNCKDQPRLYASFKKYGVEKHLFEIIEECVESNLKTRERFYQDRFDVLDQKKGLNCLLTETSEKKRVVAKSTKDKISKAQKGKKINENQRKALEEGRVYVKLHQFDLEGNLVKVWDNVKSAMTENSCDISSHLYNKKSHAGNYIWLRENEIHLLGAKLENFKLVQSKKGKYEKSEEQIQNAKKELIKYNKSRKGKSKLDKYKNDILEEYKTYSVGFLTNKYECSKPTMIKYLKSIDIYEFRRNYQKLI